MDAWGFDTSVLRKLEPYSFYLLASAAILLLISIAGGARLEIKDLRLGPVGAAARTLAAVLSLALAGAFLLIPQASKEASLKVAGRLIVPRSVELPGDIIEVGLSEPRPEARKTALEHNRNFTFVEGHGIKSGQYAFSVFTREGKIVENLVTVRKDEQLVVQFVTRDFIRQVSAGGAEDIIDFFTDRYSVRKWGERVDTILELSEMARHDDEIEKALVSSLSQRGSPRADLAVFVLGELCKQEKEVQAILEAIMNDETDWIYRRLRAAYGLWCVDRAGEGAREFLWNTLKDHPEPGARQAAAFFLANGGARHTCIVEKLITGLGNDHPKAQDLSHDALVELTKQDFGLQPHDWDEWWTENASAWRPCP